MASKKTAGSKTTAGKKSAPLDPKVADKLLDLLSTDNEFRRLFKKNPRAALAKVGYQGPPFTPPGPPQMRPPVSCTTVKSIAPKAEIAAARDRLHQMLTSATVFTTPHSFEAGEVDKAFRRK